MRAKFGDAVYDPNSNIYDPVVEDIDLMTVLKPIAEKKQQRKMTQVKEKVSALFMKADGGKIGRKERTYILDEKEAEERKAKEFNIKNHINTIAQYRVAGVMQKNGEDLTLESVARTDIGR